MPAARGTIRNKARSKALHLIRLLSANTPGSFS
jgi:hypothetical protein